MKLATISFTLPLFTVAWLSTQCHGVHGLPGLGVRDKRDLSVPKTRPHSLNRLTRKLAPGGGGESATCPYADVDKSDFNKELPFLDLSVGAADRPVIDGDINNGVYSGTSYGDDAAPTPPEYVNFLTLPMYNGGRNNDGSPQIAVAEVAYDCTNQIVCAAAYYTPEYVEGAFVSLYDKAGVVQSDENSWIEFGRQSGATKLKRNSGNNIAFQYISLAFEGLDTIVVGWEGCWNGVAPSAVLNKELQVHFNRDPGETTSTGKDVGDSFLLCITGECPTVNCEDAANDGEVCTTAGETQGCCDYDDVSGTGTCVEGTSACPAVCVPDECAATTPVDECQKYACLDGSCREVADATQDGNICGDDSPCTPTICSGGACTAVTPAPTNCDYDGDGTDDDGYCCAGLCQENACTGCPSPCDDPSFSVSSGDLPAHGATVTLECAGPIPDPVDITATYCDGTTATSTPTEVLESQAGECSTTIRTWNFPATDCGGAQAYQVTYAIVDNEDPLFDASAPTRIDRECGSVDDGAAFTAPTVTDNCATEELTPLLSQADNGGTYCDDGITKILTWTATDDCDNEMTFSQSLYVKDTLAPVLDMPGNLNLECGADETPTAPTATDQCDSRSVTINDKGLTTTGDYCSDGGKVIQQKWTAADGCDNESAEETQTITVKDTKAPEFVTVPEETKILECGDPDLETYEASLQATATDECDADVTIVRDNEALIGDNFCDAGKTKTITWTATDDCQQFVEYVHTITVKDTKAPGFVLAPEDKTLECGVDDLGAYEASLVATATDTCDGDVIPVRDDQPLSGDSFCAGKTKTITWTATDACDQSVSHTHTITVKDETAPVWDATAPAPAGPVNSICSDPCIAETCTGGLPGAEDACTAVDVTYCDVAETTMIPPGVKYTRTFYAEDECGLTTKCENNPTQVINVVDDCKFEVGTAFSGLDINVAVSINNVVPAEGSPYVLIEVEVADDTLVADLRGLFFDIVDVDLQELDIEVLDPPQDSTNFVCDEGGVVKVAKDVLMSGRYNGQAMPSYECGVEIGTPGKGKDDIPRAVIKVSSKTDVAVTTNNFADASYVGIRLTSVGEDGTGREDSSKIFDPISCCRYEAPAEEPICTSTCDDGSGGGGGGDGGGDTGGGDICDSKSGLGLDCDCESVVCSCPARRVKEVPGYLRG